VVEGPVKRLLVRSGAWKADWHVLDLHRTAGGDWSYTICRLMLRPVEQADEEPSKGRVVGCPLCIAELQKEAQASGT
jgi:hypothetical protein